mgnify:CR=1 FL=1
MEDLTEYKNLKDKTIIITGGSQGIGKSMVEEFVKQKSKDGWNQWHNHPEFLL